jgi:hypothetical protein
MFYLQVLSSRRFQHRFHRYNMHRLTESSRASGEGEGSGRRCGRGGGY